MIDIRRKLICLTRSIIKHFLFLLLLGFSSVQAEEKPSQNSLPSNLAVNKLILDAQLIGNKIIAVGDRGHVLINRDGKSWQQVELPTRNLLTSVFFINETTGWIAGHDALILKTSDGGVSWRIVYQDIEVDAPLFDVHFFDEQNGVAIGAYGLFLRTQDGGENWQQEDFNIKRTEVNDDEEEDFFDYHLHKLVVQGGESFYIVAEAGYLFRSNDKGKSWTELESPYHGSFFSLLALGKDNLLLCGLRGHLYRSEDNGVSWHEIKSNTNELLTSIYQDHERNIYVSGHGGTVLLSDDEGSNFTKQAMKTRDNYLGVVADINNRLYLYGEMGMRLLSTQLRESMD